MLQPWLGLPDLTRWLRRHCTWLFRGRCAPAGASRGGRLDDRCTLTILLERAGGSACGFLAAERVARWSVHCQLLSQRKRREQRGGGVSFCRQHRGASPAAQRSGVGGRSLTAACELDLVKPAGGGAAPAQQAWTEDEGPAGVLSSRSIGVGTNAALRPGQPLRSAVFRRALSASGPASTNYRVALLARPGVNPAGRSYDTVVVVPGPGRLLDQREIGNGRWLLIETATVDSDRSGALLRTAGRLCHGLAKKVCTASRIERDPAPGDTRSRVAALLRLHAAGQRATAAAGGAGRHDPSPAVAAAVAPCVVGMFFALDLQRFSTWGPAFGPRTRWADLAGWLAPAGALIMRRPYVLVTGAVPSAWRAVDDPWQAGAISAGAGHGAGRRSPPTAGAGLCSSLSAGPQHCCVDDHWCSANLGSAQLAPLRGGASAP